VEASYFISFSAVDVVRTWPQTRYGGCAYEDEHFCRD
jgi:hypothetical protein